MTKQTSGFSFLPGRYWLHGPWLLGLCRCCGELVYDSRGGDRYLASLKNVVCTAGALTTEGSLCDECCDLERWRKDEERRFDQENEDPEWFCPSQ